MSISSLSTRRIVLSAVLGALTLGTVTPALAVEKSVKAIKVTMPASAVKDPASKLCMPQTITGAKRDKSLPATMCLTRDEWAAQGVTIVVKS